MPANVIEMKAKIDMNKYKTYPEKVLIYTTYPEMIKAFELKIPNVKFLTQVEGPMVKNTVYLTDNLDTTTIYY